MTSAHLAIIAHSKGIVGLAQGIGGVVIPTYLSETAPAPIRGAMINAIILNQWLGTFMSVAVAYSVRTNFTSKLWLMPVRMISLRGSNPDRCRLTSIYADWPTTDHACFTHSPDLPTSGEVSTSLYVPADSSC